MIQFSQKNQALVVCTTLLSNREQDMALFYKLGARKTVYVVWAAEN
jgi:hypothetical protein